MIRMCEPPTPTIEGDRLRIVFEEWGPESYQVFLRSKRLPEHRIDYDWELDRYVLTAPARFAPMFGIEPPVRGTRLPLSPHERFYQAVRRAYRYGQRKSVRVHVPYIPELQGPIYENVQAKQAQFDRDAEIMERYYAAAMEEVTT